MSGAIHLLTDFETPAPLSCRRCDRELPGNVYVTIQESGMEVECVCPNCGAPLTFWLVKP